MGRWEGFDEELAKKVKTIFLDMDGVLANFVMGACKLFERDYDQTIREWPKGEYGIEKVFGVSRSEFWKKVDSRGTHFWSSLPEYPEAGDLTVASLKFGDTYVATTPSLSSDSMAGKLAWMDRIGKQLRSKGEAFRNYVLTPHKHLLAGPESLLIDDSVENVNLFVERGGEAILVSRPWNASGLPLCDIVRLLQDAAKKKCQK